MKRMVVLTLLLGLFVAGAAVAAAGSSGGFTSEQCFTCHSDLAMLDMLVGLKVPPPEECSI